jgi:hypothetical protein
MIPRLSLLVVVLFQLSGCVATPRVEISQQLDFDYVPNMSPMSYSDMLCCYDCQA